MAVNWHAQILDAIRDRLEAQLALFTGLSAAQVGWPGQEFHAEGLTQWIALRVRFEGAEPADISSGGENTKLSGAAIVWCAVRQDGADAARQLADWLDAARQTFPESLNLPTPAGRYVRFDTPEPDEEEFYDDGTLAQSVRCPWSLYTL